jgi:hypothetical protein
LFGIIVPGGWEEFFRFVGMPYDGPLWPGEDDSKSVRTLIAKMDEAAGDYDMTPVPTHPRVGLQQWTEQDNVLHGDSRPFFLRNGRGPSATIGGSVIRPIITGAESDNKFTLGSIEGSRAHPKILSKGIVFKAIHHCIFVQDGQVDVTINDAEQLPLRQFETAFLPAGTKFNIQISSRYAKAYIYSNPGGIVDVLYEAGKEHPHTLPNCMIPDNAKPFDELKLHHLKGISTFELL